MTDLFLFRPPAPSRHRMKLLVVVAIGFAFLCVAPSDPAQQPDPASPSPLLGSVLVHVSDAATGLPVRFAEVLLIPKPDAKLDPPGVSGASGEAQPDMQKPHHVQSARGYSDLNGDANLAGVPAGEYFVSAVQPAYLTPADTSIYSASTEQVNALVAAVPSIRVTPGAAASVSIPLHRGAVVSGRIQFADGSPAIGLRVGAEYAEETPFSVISHSTPNQQLLLSLSTPNSRRNENVTDDQGRYRIAALRPGKYIVTTGFYLPQGLAQVAMENGTGLQGRREYIAPQLVPVFYPGIFRRENAKRITITASEEITGADITIDRSGLHTLSGRVFAGEDRHVPSRALVYLLEKGEPSRSTETEEDGTFQINYLAPGSYSLAVRAVEEPVRSGAGDFAAAGTVYQTFKINITISDRDVSLDDIVVAPLKPGESPQLPF